MAAALSDSIAVVEAGDGGIGFGRTLNFAHPVSWVMFAAPIVIAVIVAAYKG